MQPKDFSHREHFPGTIGNPFDVVLHRYMEIRKIPSILFAILLLVLALIPSHFHIFSALAYWSFFLLDWLLLAMLPKTGRSYGPAKPTAILLAVFRLPFAFIPVPYSFIIQALGTLLVIYGFWIEPHRIRVTYQELRSAKLPDNFSIKVLHLGDIHVERFSRREKQLNEMIRELKPDLILFSGDFLNLSYLDDVTAKADLREILQQWNAPLGVYAVAGSPAVDRPGAVSALINDTPVCLLQDETITLHWKNSDLDLIGLTCTHKPFVDAPRLRGLLDGRQNRFTLLLYHSPDLAPEIAGWGIDLQLSGHTHGGQIRLPILGALYTASLYGRRFSSGRYTLDDMTLYITRGVGMEGAAAPRVRFLCPPEIILWQISGEKK